MVEQPPFAGPSLTALIELPIPGSWSKPRTLAAIVGEIRPTSRLDIDNFVKSGMDAINGIVVADDSLIVQVSAEKKYGIDPKPVLLIELSANQDIQRRVAEIQSLGAKLAALRSTSSPCQFSGPKIGSLLAQN